MCFTALFSCRGGYQPPENQLVSQTNEKWTEICDLSKTTVYKYIGLLEA